MSVDIDKLTSILNTTTLKIKEASDVVQRNPAEAMSFVGPIMEQIKELASLGNLSEFSASEATPEQQNEVREAVNSFLTYSKEAQEKVGVMGASLFGNPQVKDVFSDLERVKTSLERGKKVEGTEDSPSVG